MPLATSSAGPKKINTRPKSEAKIRVLAKLAFSPLTVLTQMLGVTVSATPTSPAPTALRSFLRDLERSISPLRLAPWRLPARESTRALRSL